MYLNNFNTTQTGRKTNTKSNAANQSIILISSDNSFVGTQHKFLEHLRFNVASRRVIFSFIVIHYSTLFLNAAGSN